MKIFKYVALLIVLAIASAFAYQYSRDWMTLRAAVPPLGPSGQRMLQDLARESVKESTWLKMRRVPVADAASAAAAIEKGEADVALVRSDIAMPRNGRSIAVFETLYALLIVPPRTKIEDFKGLKDKTIAVVSEGSANDKLLDLILSNYGVPDASVRRLAMKPEEVGPAMQQRKITAAFVVGTIAGASAQTFNSIQKAMKGTPTVLGVEEAEAVRRDVNGIEAAEVSKGMFGGSPAQPEEDLTTISTAMRIVVPSNMSTMVAGELTRVLFEGKAKALIDNPHMREMKQPDADEKEYPIHPAAQTYFDGETPTLMDRFESFFWLGWAVLGLIGSLIGWILSKVKRGQSPETERFNNLLVFLQEVRQADADQLDGLQARLDDAVRMLVEQRDSEEMSADTIAIFSVAIEYARNLISERYAQLRTLPAK